MEKLRTAEVELSEGRTFAEVARKLEVSEQTVHRWRNVYGGMKGPEVARLKELERENARLKKIVAGHLNQTLSYRVVQNSGAGQKAKHRKERTQASH